jgi:serine/threonine protein kinase, bacterial
MPLADGATFARYTIVRLPSSGSIASPTVTTEPTDTPLPTEDESPIRVCMQQTGKTRLQCWESIRRSNGLAVP